MRVQVPYFLPLIPSDLIQCIRKQHMTYLKYTRTGGKVLNLQLSTPAVYKVSNIVRDSLPSSRIVGIDTESIKYGGELHTKYLQLWTDTGYEKLYDTFLQDPLLVLFDSLMSQFGEDYIKEHDLKQRSKEQRAQRQDKKDGRDGRRQTVQPIVLAFFNMDYDLGRLIDKSPTFRRNLAYGKDSISFPYKGYIVEIVYSCVGVACPSFQWYVRHPDNRKVIRVVGFDSTSYFKTSLAKVTKSLQVHEKIDLEELTDLFLVDWKTNPPSDEHLKLFEEYSLNDARCHTEVYHAIVKLLTNIDPAIIDKIGCIPASGPSAAARMMLHLSSEDEYTGPPVPVQQLGLDAYKGAISFCVRPGYVQDISVADISSAYPHVCTLLPDMAKVEYKRIPPTADYQQYYGKFGVAVIDGESLDSVYPPLVTYNESKQRGIYGRFKNIVTTLPEIEIGVKSGRLRIDRIHTGVVLEGPVDSSGLRKFVLGMYEIKNTSVKKSPMYEMAKLLMNALYGKLIEKRHVHSIIPLIDRYGNHLVVPNNPDKAAMKEIELAYAVEEDIQEVLNHATFLADGKSYGEIPLSEYIGQDTWETGYYFNSVYAANITGFTRAKLMCAAAYANALAGDTDSIFIPSDVSLEKLVAHLNKCGAITPMTGLGSFEIEVTGVDGLLVKKKMYALWNTDGTPIQDKIKHHTISGVRDTNQMIRIMKSLHASGSAEYVTVPKPVRLKEGLRHDRVLGLFLTHDMKLKLESDPYKEIDSTGLQHWKDISTWQEITKS